MKKSALTTKTIAQAHIRACYRCRNATTITRRFRDLCPIGKPLVRAFRQQLIRMAPKGLRVTL